MSTPARFARHGAELWCASWSSENGRSMVANDNGGRTGKATGMVMMGALAKPSNTATARIRPLTTNQWVSISQTIIIAEQQTCRDQQRRW
jgi:hypothetical protein